MAAPLHTHTEQWGPFQLTHGWSVPHTIYSTAGLARHRSPMCPRHCWNMESHSSRPECGDGSNAAKVPGTGRLGGLQAPDLMPGPLVRSPTLTIEAQRQRRLCRSAHVTPSHRAPNCEERPPTVCLPTQSCAIRLAPLEGSAGTGVSMVADLSERGLAPRLASQVAGRRV